MKWCEHMISSKDDSKFDEDKDGYAYCDGYFEKVSRWKLCPICGTPRPKEQTLEEKFIKMFKQSGEQVYANLPSGFITYLAQTAIEHFEETK